MSGAREREAPRKDRVLSSKLQVPDTPRQFLVRERLLERLDRAEEPLLIISAGMGYGKTVLLTHYARRCPEPCAWYHLGESDNDIMVFARYLWTAVSRAAPELEFDLTPYLALDQDEMLVRSLALDFAEMLRGLEGTRLHVILDNVQVIQNEWVFLFLTLLLDSRPQGLRLLLGTKSAPPPFCARYLLEGAAQILEAESLAFTLEEVERLIEPDTDPRQLSATAQALQARMEGWPAGLSFTMLYARQRRLSVDQLDMEQACQPPYLRDYLMHELYRKLPFDLQQFLVRTSVLEYLRPDVCNALTGADNAAGQLAYLEQENLFILRLSGGGAMYRYHALFRDFLLSQLQPGQRAELLAGAADFYLRTPDKAQAAEYAIACGDGERLQSALEDAGREALFRGELSTVRRWLEELKTMDAPLTPETDLLRAQYRERVGDWQGAMELAEQLIDGYPERTGERCMLEARLLRARLTRERGAAAESLELLEGMLPRLRMRHPRSALRRQAAELILYNLLDLHRADEVLRQVLAGLEESLTARDPQERDGRREEAVVCFFATGEYRRAMQMYVLLRGEEGEGGAVVAPYIQLYLALSGRPGPARARMGRAVENMPGWVSHQTMQDIILIQALVEQIARMDGGDPDKPVQTFWDSGVLRGGSSSRFQGGFSVLCRALLRQPMDPETEDALFVLERRDVFGILDGVRWLAVRQCARRGAYARALELCRRTRPEREAWRSGTGRGNAFLAFLDLEEALLLREKDWSSAAELARNSAAYRRENGLICPGLTEEERTALMELEREEEPLPAGGVAEEARVHVRCFGPFRVFLPDGQELRWRTRKAQELFAYLFHVGGAWVDREKLMDILWPQSAPANATSLLHTSLYNIRKGLAPYGLDRMVVREKKCYRLDLELVESDREVVEAVFRGEGPVEELARRYAGPYLEDVESVWAEDQRAWYAGNFLRVSREEARRRMEREEFAAAAEYLRSAIRQEPYDEELAGQLLRCYGALGEVRNAMTLYNRLKDTLKEDLDAEPGEEVTRIYQECLLRRLDSGRSPL